MVPATRQSASVDAVEGYAAAAERFAAAVAFSDPRARVPSCPGWSTYDLVVHLGNVHAWAATIVETGSVAAEQNDEPRSSRARALSQWYVGKAGDLYEVLRTVDPDHPCWNFAYGAGVAGFWQRRQLHETTVHQVDLDLAAGRPLQVDADVAADGIDEVLTVFAHRMARRGHGARLDGRLALSATDTGDTWLLGPPGQAGADAAQAPVPAQPPGGTTAGRPPTVERRRAVTVDVQDRVEAPAEVLYRVLWKRLPVDQADLAVHGDAARVRAFLDSRLVP